MILLDTHILDLVGERGRATLLGQALDSGSSSTNRHGYQRELLLGGRESWWNSVAWSCAIRFWSG